ncbi:hypothetical protein [Ectobacillus ponti]|uniref:Uncharacterized protein n=1 Tax=Ectobacillus ponti TaxID=2961894 RepID=A0AA41XCG3_9BACI|nr:hypothetical protein [Ectobacillus ponti]MCP8970895.1 hypothetical protein [Ectobacillus ponti]
MAGLFSCGHVMKQYAVWWNKSHFSNGTKKSKNETIFFENETKKSKNGTITSKSETIPAVGGQALGIPP